MGGWTWSLFALTFVPCEFKMALYTLRWVPTRILLVASVQFCLTCSRTLIWVMSRIHENLRLRIGVNIHI